MRVTIDGEEYVRVTCPAAKKLDSNAYCNRGDGATLELRLIFETQEDRDRAFLEIRKLVGRDV